MSSELANMTCWGSAAYLGLCWPSLGLCWPILRLCWPMPMRTKCCNLQHFALWDGKNPCKHHSFSPRKWLKHSYFQSFVHITIFDFLKNVQIPAFFAFIKTKNRFKKCKKCYNLQGSGPQAKNCVNTSVSASKSCQNTAIYSVSCLPRLLEIAETL